MKQRLVLVAVLFTALSAGCVVQQPPAHMAPGTHGQPQAQQGAPGATGPAHQASPSYDDPEPHDDSQAAPEPYPESYPEPYDDDPGTAGPTDLEDADRRSGAVTGEGPGTVIQPKASPVAAPGPVPAASPGSPPPGPVRRARLRRSGPHRCGGKQVLRLTRLQIQSPRDGVVVGGRCEVVIEDSQIIAGGRGIRVSGRGRVTVTRTIVRGQRGSVMLSGDASLTARDTVFSGDFERLDRAAYRDLGNNSFRGPDALDPGDEPAGPSPGQPPGPTPRPTAPPDPVPGGTPPPIAPAPAPPIPDSLQDSGPIACRGDETLRLSRLRIVADSSGLTVSGRCRVVITDSQILASRFGIRVTDQGQVTVRHSSVRGGSAAVELLGRATLSARGSEFFGSLVRRDSAVYRDTGGNEWKNGGVVGPPGPGSGSPGNSPAPRPAPETPAPRPEPPGPDKLQPSGPLQCKGTETLRLTRLHIQSRKNGLVVRGSCNVTLRDSRIDAGGFGLEIAGNGTVRVIDSQIRGSRGSVTIQGRGQLSARGTVFVGPVERQGNGSLLDGGRNQWK